MQGRQAPVLCMLPFGPGPALACSPGPYLLCSPAWLHGAPRLLQAAEALAAKLTVANLRLEQEIREKGQVRALRASCYAELLQSW